MLFDVQKQRHKKMLMGAIIQLGTIICVCDSV